MKELRGNSKCPCGSGLRYSGCCRKRKLKWEVDTNGNIFRTIHLTPEAIEVLHQAEEDFKRIFERDCKQSDRVFLVGYIHSDEEIERITIEMMRNVGIRPEIIYAYKKTGGLMLTEINETFATTKDLDDWEQAIDEYFYLEENPPDPDPIESLFDSLEQELNSCIICLGYTLDQGLIEQATKTPSSSMYFSVDDYVLLCATKSIKTLRAIKALTAEEIGSDCLTLARHIFENYLHCIFCINKPEMMEHLVDAVVGLKMGTHEYAKHNNGKVDGRKIIRLSDGQAFIGQISTYRMAESSDYESDLALFDYMYSFLSDYTHPSFNSLSLVFSDKGYLDPLSNELKLEAIFFSICFSAMVLDQINRLECIHPEIKDDIRTVVRRIHKKADLLLLGLFDTKKIPKQFSILRQRLSELGKIKESPQK